MTRDQKLYYSMTDLARQLFQALDDEILFIYKQFEQGQGEYPGEKSVGVLLAGAERGLGRSKALSAMDENMARDLANSPMAGGEK
jgi:hypothetical protein